MDPRYYPRPLSPGGRRLVPPERASTGTFGAYNDPYYPQRSPRSSGERILPPVVHPTYVTHAPSHAPSSSSRAPAYDAYSGRPRRSTLTEADATRPRHGPIPIRTTVVHAPTDRPSSPLARSWDGRDMHVTPAATAPPKREHKKVYSVDEGHTRLIDERDLDSRDRKRDSMDRSHRSSGHKHYHLNGPLVRPQVDDDYYSYTDAAGMYRDTEPKWRHRRGSVDGRKERPSSAIFDPYGPNPRTSRDMGPPPSTRGFDKINGAGIGRSGSLRNEPARSSSRDRHNEYSQYRDVDPYGGSARSSSVRIPIAVHQDRDDRREDRYSSRDDYDRHERRRHTDRYADPDVASRGFGVRTSGPDPYGPAPDDDLDRADRAPVYPVEPGIMQPNVRDYLPVMTEEERREQDRRDREYVLQREWEQERRERERDRERHRDRDVDKDRDSNRDHDRRERDTDRDRRDRDRDDRAHLPSAVPAAVAATAAYGVNEALSRSAPDRRYEDADDRNRRARNVGSSDSSDPRERERHYPEKDAERDDRKKETREKAADALDPDEEYRRRVQAELERSGKFKDRDASDSDREQRRHDRHERHAREREEREASHHHGRDDEVKPQEKPDRYHERHNSIFDAPLVSEPGEINASVEPGDDRERERENRVRIVEPPKSDKDSPPPPKGILRKPTEKFPEDPNPIREGVAPLKDAKKGKDIPPGARWTKIDRRLVNPEALDEAKERFEERMDCVIVLRVLTKEEIQKLADRTREIREAREDERYDRDRKEGRRHKHRHRDDEYDDYSSTEDERERRLAIEPPR